MAVDAGLLQQAEGDLGALAILAPHGFVEKLRGLDRTRELGEEVRVVPDRLVRLRKLALGFDELVVYGPGGPGERFTSEPAVHAEALAQLRR